MDIKEDDFVLMIKTYSNPVEIQNVLLPYLKHLPNNILTRVVPQDPLEVLNPETYSIGYLYILLARRQVSEFNSIRDNCIAFLEVFDVELVSSMASAELKQFLLWICESVNAINKSFSIISTLRLILERYRDFTITLTPIHVIFVKQCFVAKAYKEAQFLLDSDIEFFHKSNEITYIDYLLYHFYGALLYVKLKFFSRALYFLGRIISALTLNTSAIQINAYKKFVILSLIVNGKMEHVPYITDAISIKSYIFFGKAYNIFAKAYEHQDHEEIKDTYFEYRNLFIKDKNDKIVKYAIKFLSYHEIYRLNEIYTCISIMDINKKIGPWNK
ncbi:hypothetical protein PORY_000648 [Pneumocystis oryctolagi]|uniref:Uncharacterized protein n=1 Tax=Pneumocystis oryctolagi TaxID=42067 RepID=A0ACB7CFL4_9ASCO|nr:hypothetical protein PORY_000648 [Pneumocystis oryctolagi]